MSILRLPEPHTPDLPAVDFRAVQVGHLVGLDTDGRPLVCFKGALAASVVARMATADQPPREPELCQRPAVLLAFEDGDPSLPLIVGFVRADFPSPQATRSVATLDDPSRRVEVNGKVLVFEGQEEIVFRCGLGSLTIRSNGHIVVKGTRLVSRASETNRIRGASVQIN